VFRDAFGPNSSVGLSPEGGDDLVGITAPALEAYDLKTSLGPITQAPPDFPNVGEACAATLGDLAFSDGPGMSVTFRAIRTVPEPSSLVLAALGLVPVGRRGAASCD